jgi:hypothetical protein
LHRITIQQAVAAAAAAVQQELVAGKLLNSMVAQQHVHECVLLLCSVASHAWVCVVTVCAAAVLCCAQNVAAACDFKTA